MTKNQNAVAVQDKQTRNTVKERLGKTALVTGVVGASAFMNTMAVAALDVAPLETEISSNGAGLQTVMLAVLALAALFVGYKLIKKSMA